MDYRARQRASDSTIGTQQPPPNIDKATTNTTPNSHNNAISSSTHQQQVSDTRDESDTLELHDEPPSFNNSSGNNSLNTNSNPNSASSLRIQDHQSNQSHPRHSHHREPQAFNQGQPQPSITEAHNSIAQHRPRMNQKGSSQLSQQQLEYQQRQAMLLRQQHHQQRRQANLQLATASANHQHAKLRQQQHTLQQQHSLEQVTSGTSSTSEQTADELHHLAGRVTNHYGHNHQHLGHQQRGPLSSSRQVRPSAGCQPLDLASSASSGQTRLLRSHLEGAHDDPMGLYSSGGGGHSGGRFLLGVLFTLAELLLMSVLALWVYWCYQHDDGISWQADRKQQFNAHASLMLLGFVFLQGQAMLVYRSFQCCAKIYAKTLHASLLVCSTSAIALGLVIAYAAQDNVGTNNKPIMHFYSLHAWAGLATCGLFGLQFLVGFVSFLLLVCCHRATASFRAALVPVHRTFGLIIYSLATATCLMGLLQTARSRLSAKLNKIDYHELAEPGIVINLIGAALICLVVIMPYIIRNLDITKRTNYKTVTATAASSNSDIDRRLMLSQLDMRI